MGCLSDRQLSQFERLTIRFSGGLLTYAELDMYASQLAAHLAARGVTNESIVGVLSERSPDMLIAVLAVLKAEGRICRLILRIQRSG